jgi:predicted aconitase with swiveling domain
MPEARTLVAGTAEGRALVLDEPLSFWGGVDPATGDIIEARHPQHGENVAGRILVMPSGRGSSSSSSVLAEAIRAGTAPAAIVVITSGRAPSLMFTTHSSTGQPPLRLANRRKVQWPP